MQNFNDEAELARTRDPNEIRETGRFVAEDGTTGYLDYYDL